MTWSDTTARRIAVVICTVLFLVPLRPAGASNYDSIDKHNVSSAAVGKAASWANLANTDLHPKPSAVSPPPVASLFLASRRFFDVNASPAHKRTSLLRALLGLNASASGRPLHSNLHAASVGVVSALDHLGQHLPCRVDASLPDSMPHGDVYLVAANLRNNEPLMPHFLRQLLTALLQHLTATQADGQLLVSVYESGSNDQTAAYVAMLEVLLEALGIPHAVTAAGRLSRSGERIAFLAKVRNLALLPLWHSKHYPAGYPADRIVFLNDVWFCMQDVLRLAQYRSADAVCGMDFDRVSRRRQLLRDTRDFMAVTAASPELGNAMEGGRPASATHQAAWAAGTEGPRPDASAVAGAATAMLQAPRSMPEAVDAQHDSHSRESAAQSQPQAGAALAAATATETAKALATDTAATHPIPASVAAAAAAVAAGAWHGQMLSFGNSSGQAGSVGQQPWTQGWPTQHSSRQLQGTAATLAAGPLRVPWRALLQLQQEVLQELQSPASPQADEDMQLRRLLAAVNAQLATAAAEAAAAAAAPDAGAAARDPEQQGAAEPPASSAAETSVTLRRAVQAGEDLLASGPAVRSLQGTSPWLLFYDTWVARDVQGSRFDKTFPVVAHGASAAALRDGWPFPVQCCWNGLVVLNAAPFRQRGLRFRSHSPEECRASECSLMCDDFWRLGFQRFLVDPSIRQTYAPWEPELLYDNLLGHRVPLRPWSAIVGHALKQGWMQQPAPQQPPAPLVSAPPAAASSPTRAARAAGAAAGGEQQGLPGVEPGPSLLQRAQAVIQAVFTRLGIHPQPGNSTRAAGAGHGRMLRGSAGGTGSDDDHRDVLPSSGGAHGSDGMGGAQAGRQGNRGEGSTLRRLYAALAGQVLSAGVGSNLSSGSVQPHPHARSGALPRQQQAQPQSRRPGQWSPRNQRRTVHAGDADASAGLPGPGHGARLGRRVTGVQADPVQQLWRAVRPPAARVCCNKDDAADWVDFNKCQPQSLLSPNHTATALGALSKQKVQELAQWAKG